MEFSPFNPIVKLCIQGIDMNEKGKLEEALECFNQGWAKASNDFEKFIAAYYTALLQNTALTKLHWLNTALQHALKTNNVSVKSAFTTLYTSIAKCYEELNDVVRAKENVELALSSKNSFFDKGPFYHGTKADLKIGEMLMPGGSSNCNSEIKMNHIYFTALANGAGLAATLAKGNELERVYIVEPTGTYENDPNLTDKKFPGNLTRSYRSEFPLKIVGEITNWIQQSPEEIQKFREKLADNRGEIIN